MLEVSNKRHVIVCAGVQGTGKSTFALRYLVNAPLEFRFIFDPEDEYSQRLKLSGARDAYGLSLQLCTGWVLFDPHTMFAGRLDAAFAFFCEWTFEMSDRLPGRKLVVVDEAWKYVNTRTHPVELEACVRSGRKRGLQCLFNTQTPNLLHSTIRNECSELVCFRLSDKNCLAMPDERGFNVEEIKALPDLHFISRNLDSGGELRGAIKV
jgi:hypothetical protein